MKIGTSAVLTILLAASSITAAENKPPTADISGARKMADQLLTMWCGDYSTGALSGFVKSCWCKPQEADEIAAQIESQRRKLDTTRDVDDGKRLAEPFELLGSRCLGTSNVRLVYLEKYERKAVPWAFSFYRAENEWKLGGIQQGDVAREEVSSMAVDTTADVDKAVKLADAFMKDLTSGEESKACGNLIQDHWVKPSEVSTIAEKTTTTYRSKKALAELILGKRMQGVYERVGTKTIGKSLLRLIYITKHEYGFLPVKLVFYQTQGDWKVCEIGLADAVTPDELRQDVVVKLAN